MLAMTSRRSEAQSLIGPDGARGGDIAGHRLITTLCRHSLPPKAVGRDRQKRTLRREIAGTGQVGIARAGPEDLIGQDV